jgi:menaquinone-dependent protoporphyrinogen IX oxidase
MYEAGDMQPIILYASKSGNTGKIAEEIAQELNCESLRVTQVGLASSVDLDNYDLIFIGTGIHFGNPDEDLVGYLKTVSLKKPKVFAFFVTWGGAGKTNQDVIAKLKTILESKGQRVIEECFICYGGWNFLRRGTQIVMMPKPRGTGRKK